MNFDAIYEPNPADDVPYVRPKWLPEDGWRIEMLDGSFWFKSACGPFDTNADAVTYLQEHLPDFAGQTLRIGGRAYQVRSDGLYIYRDQKGYTLMEGVQS
jgi:hypothetical protein